MRSLENFTKIDSYKDIPQEGLYIVLTQSKSGFLGKAIQGFMRLWQWLRDKKDTDLIPNHADLVNNGYAIGALAFGVDGNDFDSHFSGNATFYVIEPILGKAKKAKMWEFMKEQQKEKYNYFDILRYAVMTITNKWFGKEEDLDRKKWTCFSLVASAYNYAVGEEFFKDPYNITPYEVCKQIDELHNKKFR